MWFTCKPWASSLCWGVSVLQYCCSTDGLMWECLSTLPQSGALYESPRPRVCLLPGAVRARDTWRIQRDLSTGNAIQSHYIV